MSNGNAHEPYCVFAVEAVELLRKNGFKAHRMQEGGSRVEAESAGVASRKER